MGRVFRDRGGPRDQSGVAQDLRDAYRRITRWGVSDAHLSVTFEGASCEVVTDKDGYFHAELNSESGWTGSGWLTAEIQHRDSGASATAELFIPPPDSRFTVVSDIDDTVMHTGVANKAVMMWNLFFQGAESREAFPGVGALLRALHDGRSGRESNLMLYVSRAPWSIYEMLDVFFKMHEIPVGPILFLREWGMTLQSPWPRRAKQHKIDLLRRIFQLYETKPFVLLGDSGQRDPEIYSQIVEEFPKRVAAVYIRNVSRDAGRAEAIGRLAQKAAADGIEFQLAADSAAMAEHAAAHGLIAAERVADVKAEIRALEETPVRRASHEIRSGPTGRRAAAQVQQEVEAQGGDISVSVEPERKRSRRRKASSSTKR